MTNWRDEIEQALGAFTAVAELAGAPIGPDDLVVELHDAPHRNPPRLPAGMMAVYGFWGDGCWLKVGIAGPKSGPRYVSHHYHMKAPSTLAKSLAFDARMQSVTGFDPNLPGDWIRTSTHRVNILLPAARGIALLRLLEAFLHVRLHPRYEG